MKTAIWILGFLAICATRIAAVDEEEICPESEDVYPCKCESKYHALDLTCKRVHVDEMKRVMQLFEHKKMRMVMLEEITSDYLPDGLFEGVAPTRFVIRNSNIGTMDKSKSDPFGTNQSTQKMSIFNVTATSFSVLKALLGLKELDMHQVGIPALTMNNLELTSTLETFRIIDAPIQTIEDEYFSQFFSLTQLEIAGTVLQSVSANAFDLGFDETLEELYLRDNDLKSFEDGAFVQLTKLRTVDLSKNALTTIKRNWFPEHFTGHIIAHGNPLDCAKELKWLIEFLNRDQRKRVSCSNGHNLYDYLESIGA